MTLKNVQNLTPAYKLMLGQDLRCCAAGGDIHTGCMVVAEHPAACRQCRDATAVTHDNAVAAGRCVVRGWWWWVDAAGEDM